LFGGDVGRYAYFEQQVNAVNAQLRGVLDEILSHHDIAAKDIVWRHTETRVENLHFDEDRNSDAIESVRAYLNMDEVPRIWHTTHTLSLLMAHYYSELDLKRYENEPLERLLHVLSVRLFGNWHSRGREQFPHHMVLFEPGDLWITDGRTVPHQVIYGRRVISTFYRLAIDHLPDWHPSLSNRVRQLHRSLQAGPDNRPYDNGEPAYDMRGLAYPFGEAGPKPPRGVKPIDLRADWATIYEESIQQTLVRL